MEEPSKSLIKSTLNYNPSIGTWMNRLKKKYFMAQDELVRMCNSDQAAINYCNEFMKRFRDELVPILKNPNKTEEHIAELISYEFWYEELYYHIMKGKCFSNLPIRKCIPHDKALLIIADKISNHSKDNRKSFIHKPLKLNPPPSKSHHKRVKTSESVVSQPQTSLSSRHSSKSPPSTPDLTSSKSHIQKLISSVAQLKGSFSKSKPQTHYINLSSLPSASFSTACSFTKFYNNRASSIMSTALYNVRERRLNPSMGHKQLPDYPKMSSKAIKEVLSAVHMAPIEQEEDKSCYDRAKEIVEIIEAKGYVIQDFKINEDENVFQFNRGLIVHVNVAKGTVKVGHTLWTFEDFKRACNAEFRNEIRV